MIKKIIYFVSTLFMLLPVTPSLAKDKVVVVPLNSGYKGPGLESFIGPQKNVSQKLLELGGWTVCFSEPYSTNTTFLFEITGPCSKENLMLACRPASEKDIFTLAAHAPRADVLFNTGTDLSTTHTANGSEWYFNSNHSWGFAPEGETVRKASCDTEANKNDLRMCMHTRADKLSSGWRCGSAMGSALDWERVILHR